VHWGP
jgi:hypothetical protein